MGLHRIVFAIQIEQSDFYVDNPAINQKARKPAGHFYWDIEMVWMRNWILSNWDNEPDLNIKTKEISRRPECHISLAGKTVDANQIGGNTFNPSPHLNDSNAIYELIGTGRTIGADTPRETHADDLIGALHQQYCRAFNDPQAPLGVEWAMPGAITHAPLPDLQPESAFQAESIETLLYGARGVEDVFGMLVAGDMPDPAAVTTAPEILRLFAPPEFNAGTSRLPPSLVRREHHAVGIDSPLMTSGVSITASDSGMDA
jgi:hypothetical protein